MPLFEKKKKPQAEEVQSILQRDIPTQEMSTSQLGLSRELTISVGSDIGTRSYQQDSYACSVVRGEFAAIICDGMGGIAGGEQASKTAVSVWMSMYEAGIPDFTAFAQQSVAAMDKAVSSNGEAGGTTAAAVWIKNGRLHWMSVGDSKIYLIRNRIMNILTQEHNYQMVLDGRLKRREISEEEYNKELVRGASLVSYIGRGQIPFIDVSQTPLDLKKDDVVLICSDGLYKAIPEEKIAKIVVSYAGDFDTLASYLLDFAASSTRVRDNTTIVAIRYEGADVVFGGENVVFENDEN